MRVRIPFEQGDRNSYLSAIRRAKFSGHFSDEPARSQTPVRIPQRIFHVFTTSVHRVQQSGEKNDNFIAQLINRFLTYQVIAVSTKNATAILQNLNVVTRVPADTKSAYSIRLAGQHHTKQTLMNHKRKMLSDTTG